LSQQTWTHEAHALVNVTQNVGASAFKYFDNKTPKREV
jgi:hypothetical protein